MQTNTVGEDVRSALAVTARQFETELEARLNRVSGMPASLGEAMRFSLLSGGKRLRPSLVFWSCELCGGNRAAAVPAAMAAECVHTFSLIHDDLPAIDNDDTRRGRPSCHKKFGEAIAILAGDALLSLAFEILATDVSDATISQRMIAELATASGPAGLIGGEVADIEGESLEASSQRVAAIHSAKTARLMEAACVLGVLAARAPQSHIDVLREYGRHLGLAFQAQDDLLDALGSSDRLGKPVRRDQNAAKQTYVRAVGVEAARQRARSEAEAAITALKPLGESASRLIDLATFVVERDS
ncbi:MAG TPA: farnesyl diphosphate synthase [Phycisphaerae bacterium]|nr:farnesyl diphosphate synthase [Phycisphaerae bacterium]